METQFFVMVGNLPVAHVPSQDVMHDLFVGLATEFRNERLQGLSFSGLSQTNRSGCVKLLAELQAVQDGKHGEQLRAAADAARRMMRQIEAMDPPATRPVSEPQEATKQQAAVEQAPAEPPAATEPELSIEGMALGLLSVHSDWTDTKIAKVAGCARTTLYTFKKYMAAREILRGGKGDLPRGRKLADGTVEAWDDEGDG